MTPVEASAQEAVTPPRNPWLGASVVGILMVLLLFVLPPVAEALRGPTVVVGDTLQFDVADGWELSDEDSGLFTIFENGDATLIPTPFVEGTADEASALVESEVDALEADGGWEIGEVETGTTATGLDYWTVSATKDADATAVWALTDGEAYASFLLQSPAEDWDEILPDVQAMIDTAAPVSQEGGE